MVQCSDQTAWTCGLQTAGTQADSFTALSHEDEPLHFQPRSTQNGVVWHTGPMRGGSISQCVISSSGSADSVRRGAAGDSGERPTGWAGAGCGSCGALQHDGVPSFSKAAETGCPHHVVWLGSLTVSYICLIPLQCDGRAIRRRSTNLFESTAAVFTGTAGVESSCRAMRVTRRARLCVLRKCRAVGPCRSSMNSSYMCTCERQCLDAVELNSDLRRRIKYQRHCHRADAQGVSDMATQEGTQRRSTHGVRPCMRPAVDSATNSRRSL